MPFFRKKPVVVEAVRFNTEEYHAQLELADWCGGRLRGIRLPPRERVIQIDTMEGEMEASFGDWIIKGVKGEFYPCKPDIFTITYDPVNS